MRHFRHSSITVLSLVLTASAVTATGCSGNGSKAVLEELKQVVAGSASKVGNRAQGLLSGEAAAVPAAEDLGQAISKARTNLGDAAAQGDAISELQRAEALQKAIRDATSSAAAAANTRSSLALEAQQAVPAYATVRSASDESTVGKLGDEILHDLVCSAAMDTIAPEEKDDLANRPLTFTYMRNKTPEAAAKAVFGLAANKVGAAFGRGFQWGRYGAELANDASRHVGLITGQIKSPDLAVTTSYIYTSKICLKPPR